MPCSLCKGIGHTDSDCLQQLSAIRISLRKMGLFIDTIMLTERSSDAIKIELLLHDITETPLGKFLYQGYQDTVQARYEEARDIYAAFFEKRWGKSPETVLTDWEDKIKKASRLGGYGHHIWGIDGHRVLSEEDYLRLKPDVVLEEALLYRAGKYSFSEKAAHEVWGN